MTRGIGRSPIVVVGMHRSGTTLVVRLLDELGLFVGARTQMNHESVFFRRLNDWLFHQAGASWDHPVPMEALVRDDRVRGLAIEYLQNVVGTVRRTSYLGVGRAVRTRSIGDLSVPWGWKDPRNSFSLPVWHEVFGAAKVVHVIRHGVDVAASLRVRQQRSLAEEERRFRKVKPIYVVREKKNRFSESLRCSTLEGGFDLWGEYLKAVQRNLGRTGCEHIEVRYESLLADPIPETAALAEFCGLHPKESEIRACVRDIDPDRAFAFTRDPELRDFAERHRERLERWGYDADGGLR
jgi:LPS sulfotransferase NodH